MFMLSATDSSLPYIWMCLQHNNNYIYLHAILYYTVSQSCEDVLNCEHFCISDNSMFQCACQHGYILALDGRSCQGIYAQLCAMLINYSFKIASNLLNMSLFDVHADIDECAISYDNCDDNATCANTNGSFTCTCNKGYYGSGSICIGQ